MKFYLTTAIPYVNAAPHIGHALEFVQADTIARYHRLLGDSTTLLSGADENALKIVQAAQAAHKTPSQLTNENTQKFIDLSRALNVQFDFFQRGSDQKHHYPASQKLWQLCDKNGDIYKKTYEGLYCVGCEVFYAEDELDANGCCFEHLKKPDLVKEENYFFKLSKYQDFLLQLIESDKLKIIPEFRKNEVIAFIKQGLEDISISRSYNRAKGWGVPVPGDSTQIIYVWFDALNIYQSGIGFGWDETLYQKWWPADVHLIGKGITRFHAIYWPAILLSAGLKLPKSIVVHGYITVEGQKMSKTIGNVIDPFTIIKKYGVDPVRYYLLREIPAFADGDFSEKRFKELYNADLANGLGNLVSRIINMIKQFSGGKIPAPTGDPEKSPLRISPAIYTWKSAYNDIDKYLPQYQYPEALQAIWKFISSANRFIDDKQPWKLFKEGKKAEVRDILYQLTDSLHQIAWQLYPFLPETSLKIAKILKIDGLLKKNPLAKNSWTNIKSGTPVQLSKPLFPRIT